jgi:hypothetical protein
MCWRTPNCSATQSLDKTKFCKKVASKIYAAAMFLVATYLSSSDVLLSLGIIDLVFSAFDKNTPLIQQLSLLGNNFDLNLKSV